MAQGLPLQDSNEVRDFPHVVVLPMSTEPPGGMKEGNLYPDIRKKSLGFVNKALPQQHRELGEGNI